jgi:hypothetical protein
MKNLIDNAVKIYMVIGVIICIYYSWVCYDSFAETKRIMNITERTQIFHKA